MNAFVADKSAHDAYEKQVERLLASPHYGERWGRHWLDAARYADSDGFEKDKGRFVWFYRDWVINAFNRDLPYDQFVIEQLAGDELPHPTQDQLVATGFLRNSMINEEGGVDPEQFRMDEMFDRMDAVGKSVLGLTIQCAQCHNHKYDPIAQADYYRMFAFLNNDNESCQTMYTPDQQMNIAGLTRQDAARSKPAAAASHARLAGAEWRQWEDRVRDDQPHWTVLEVSRAHRQKRASDTFIRRRRASLLAQGYAPTKFTQLFERTTDLRKITAFRLELLNDPDLPCNGPEKADRSSGTCALSEFSVEVAPAMRSEEERGKAEICRCLFGLRSAGPGSRSDL